MHIKTHSHSFYENLYCAVMNTFCKQMCYYEIATAEEWSLFVSKSTVHDQFVWTEVIWSVSSIFICAWILDGKIKKFFPFSSKVHLVSESIWRDFYLNSESNST